MKDGDVIQVGIYTVECYRHHITGRKRLDVFRTEGWYSDQPILVDGLVLWNKPDNWPKYLKRRCYTLLSAFQKERDEDRP